MSTKICGKDAMCFEIQSCEKNVKKTFEVSVPVTVTPFAVPEKPDVKCAGEIMVTPGHICCDPKNNSLEFTITQKIIVEIPVKFGAEVCYGQPCASPLCGSGHGDDCDKQPHNHIER
jgi:hypothetical protein